MLPSRVPKQNLKSFYRLVNKGKRRVSMIKTRTAMQILLDPSLEWAQIKVDERKLFNV